MLRTDTKAGSNLVNISQNAVSIDGGCPTCWRIETCRVRMHTSFLAGGGGWIAKCRAHSLTVLLLLIIIYYYQLALTLLLSFPLHCDPVEQ